MTENRIFFHDNPWPEGHLIELFEWTLEVIDDTVWFFFHLESAEYDAEEPLVGDDPGALKDDDYHDYDEADELDDADGMDDAFDSDWENPGIWSNYRRATISSYQGDAIGFPVCGVDEFDLDYLDGLELDVDPDPDECEDENRWAFQAYLLGQDSVARHNIRFNRARNSEGFNIEWEGVIALTGSGDVDYDYEFKVEIHDTAAPEL